LKITVQQEEKESAVTVKIEGRVAGPYVLELDRVWQDLAPTLGPRKLVVDLRDVTFIDAKGRYLLAQIHDETGAAFLADTPMIKHYAKEATQTIRTSSK
jgi:anti-anti-sigma regulatory factor